jgi:hypothetical protein
LDLFCCLQDHGWQRQRSDYHFLGWLRRLSIVSA